MLITTHSLLPELNLHVMLCLKILKDPISIADKLQWLAVWLSGNALASINIVVLRQTRLVLGWVTVCGRVNHFGM